MAKQWEYTLHAKSATDAKATLQKLTTKDVPGSTKAALANCVLAATSLLETVGDGPVEVYIDRSTGNWAIVKVARRGDEPEE